jgi:formate-dependent nitrite reductase membrane component NrfD
MVHLQTEWSWLVAFYLFLGGLGAGAMVTASIVALATRERFRSTVRFATWASAIVIALGTACLLLDVGRPFRALILFRSFVQFGSWMTIGAWLLFAAIALNGLCALSWTQPVTEWLSKRWGWLPRMLGTVRTVLHVVAIPVNLAVAVYTGMLLSAVAFRPFWHTLLLPALFTASALDTGVGLVTAYATLRERSDGVRRLRMWLEISVIALIALEGTALYFFVQANLQGAREAVTGAGLLLNGQLSLAFWALVVGTGLGLPLLMCVVQLSGLSRRLPLLAPMVGVTSCLVGGFTLRTLVLLAGLPVALTSPDLQQMLVGARFLP